MAENKKRARTNQEQGDLLCHRVMEQDRKEKDPVPAKVWDVAAPAKERVAVRSAAGAKAKVVGRGKAKVKPSRQGKAANRINRLPLEKGA